MHSRRRVGKHALWLHSTAKGTMPWQLCSASVKPAGTIQVFWKIVKQHLKTV